MCVHDTVVLGAFGGCLDFILDFDEDADDGVGVGVEGLISIDNRPKSKSKAALLICGSHTDGNTVFNTNHPLINSNLRLKEDDSWMLSPMKFNIWVATTEEGRSPRRSRQIRATGNAEANLR